MLKNQGDTKPHIKFKGDNQLQVNTLILSEQQRAEILSHLLNFLDEHQAKKIQLLQYLLNNLTSDNIVIATVVQIAAATKLSKPFVLNLLKGLEQLNIVTRRTGSIHFNNAALELGKFSIVVECELQP